MTFRLISNFTKHALLQRSDLSALYNQQCRTHFPIRHRHQLHRQSRTRTTPFQVSPYVKKIQKNCYCSKSSNRGKGFLSWYLGMLETRPILTKAVSSAVIYAAADVTSQTITMEPHSSWDSLRTLRISSFGLIILGPSQHLWFNFMARLLPNRDVFSTLKKIAMGQLILGPIVNGAFFSYNASLQGENMDEIVARLRRDLVPTLMNGLKYWPLCDFLTYKVIPVHLQPLVISSFAYLWSIYLTYMASLKKVVPE